MLLDALAKRYGCLPSALLCDADSFDLMVFDVALTWEKMQQDKQNGKKTVDTTMYNQQDLQDIMNKVREPNVTP